MDKTTRPVAYEQFAALEAHGSHLCLLYEDNQDWLLGIRPFISTGLEANHKILYIASDHEEEEVLNLLSASGIDITKGLTSGQFCILPRDRYYMLNGYFDPDRTIRIIISEAKKALSEGYSALRITGETGWAFSNMADSVNLFDYEEKINSEIYDVYPCLAVCQYDMSRLNPEIMQKIIRTHSRIIYKGQILQNYNYVPVSGSKKGQRSAEEVKLWLEQIKEQLSSQYALEERERKFRLLFDTMSQGVIYVDESGAITSANPAAVNILGVTSEQLMRYGAQVPEHNYIRMDGSVITANQMPSATALNSGQAVNNFIMGFHRSGEQDLRWINVSSIPQFRPYSDRPSGVYSTFTDITDLVNSRKALAESEAKYRRIAEGMSDVVWTSDLEMKTTYVSPSVEKMMGEPAERHLGRKVEEKFPPRDILKLQDMLREELKMDATPGVSKNRSRIIELEHYKADGSLIWVSIHVSFLRDEKGNIVGIHGITRDISAFKKMEEEARLARDKAEVSARLATVGEMAAGIAHEINNPLTSVIGFSELLSREELPPESREYVKYILEGSSQVKDIVRRLLTFARQDKPYKTRLDIHKLIDNTLELRSYVLTTSNITLQKSYHPNLPWVSVDPGQMQQVFLNLLINAEQAIKKKGGAGIITITTGQTSAGDVLISFADTGTGMDASVLPKIFQPFFTTKEPGEGTGLGLALSRSIILDHKGDIRAASTPGEGAAFTIRLPSSADGPALGFPFREGAVLPSSAARQKNILVVDDEPSVRTLLRHIIESRGDYVEEAESPASALEELAGKNYDVIIMDMRMPGMNGKELYEQIIKRWPQSGQNVVFITGDAVSHETQDFLRKYRLPFIAKPFERQAVLDKLDEITGKEKTE